MMHQELASDPILHMQEGLKGFRLSMQERGEVVVDDESLMESLRPFITEKFQGLFKGNDKQNSKTQNTNPK